MVEKKIPIVWPSILLLGLLAAGATIHYWMIRRELTEAALTRRLSLARLSSAILKEKFDRIIDVGTALADRVRMRQLIAEGKWDEAIKILNGVPKNFPFIERLFFSDLKGTLMSDLPHLPGMIGKNLADRGWYEGVNQTWKPYLSGIYQRAAKPQLNVIAAAIPINSDKGTRLGILVLQLRAETVFKWTETVQMNPSGFIFLVDRKGHLLSHPKISTSEKIVDFSGVPAVEKVLRGEEGTEISIDPVSQKKCVVAYQPIPDYGGAVVVMEPLSSAFALRNKTLRLMSLGYGLVLVLGFWLIGRNLRFQSALGESEERFHSIAQSANDAVVIGDEKGRIIFWNRSAGEMFGYTEPEALNQSLTLIMPERYREKHRAGLERFKKTGRAVLIGRTIEIEGLRKDGSLFPLEITLSSWKQGGSVFFSGIIRDITGRKRAEAELIRVNQSLVSSNQELEAFSYSVSHDLRAPLRSIDGFSQALIEDYGSSLDQEAKHYLSRIRNGAQKMGELIDALLDLSRISRSPIKREPVDLGVMFQTIIDELQKAEPARNVEIVCKDGLVANGDARLLSIVLQNLVRNAWKFTAKQDHARIDFGRREESGRTIFYISDNGAGFDMAYAEKLFGPFQRLHQITEFPGIGIGLATVKRIIVRHGGRIWAESKSGAGATFYFIIEPKKEG